MSTNDKRTNRPPTPKTKGTTSRAAAPPPSPKRSPMLLLTFGAVAAGVVLVAVLALAGGLLGGGSSAALATPAFEVPVALAHGRSVGPTNAPIAIEVWADYQCPYCGQFTERIESLIVARYAQPGLARVTFRDLAFLGQESSDAAVAARVADDQGDKFWAYHGMLFANQDGENKGAFKRERLADIAVAVGLDRQAFLTAMDDPKYLAAVQQETAEGNAMGVRSTPTMFINGQRFDDLMDWAKVAAYLDNLIAAASGAPGSSSAPGGSGAPTP